MGVLNGTKRFLFSHHMFCIQCIISSCKKRSYSLFIECVERNSLQNQVGCACGTNIELVIERLLQLAIYTAYSQAYFQPYCSDVPLFRACRVGVSTAPPPARWMPFPAALRVSQCRRGRGAWSCHAIVNHTRPGLAVTAHLSLVASHNGALTALTASGRDERSSPASPRPPPPPGSDLSSSPSRP